MVDAEDLDAVVSELNKEMESITVGSLTPETYRRSSGPEPQEHVVTGEGVTREQEVQFLHCRATKGCKGQEAKKVQDVRVGYGRLLRFQCLQCNRTWALTL